MPVSMCAYLFALLSLVGWLVGFVALVRLLVAQAQALQKHVGTEQRPLDW